MKYSRFLKCPENGSLGLVSIHPAFSSPLREALPITLQQLTVTMYPSRFQIKVIQYYV